MRHFSIALLACVAALLPTACDRGPEDLNPARDATSSTPVSSTDTATVPNVILPPQSSRSVSVPSGSAPREIRRRTCEQLAPEVERARGASGQAGVDRAVAEAVAGLPGTPDWQVFSEDQRQAAIDGAHDAGTGRCR
ncbi:hypothetical protein [Nocardia blacklockiae]|uniref:hypothetical protein n=1 Tax=Nocardia blacklockiae TaxID=480036 RepID=UPI001893CBAF|nr:hypothetical protein [Nocardia blacklockiae]MBF6169940.1 hypothetical protein [Nocardia blacklockiae]